MKHNQNINHEHSSPEGLCFNKLQSFDNSNHLFLQKIQILPKRGQVIAGSLRHRDCGSLSECCNDIRLWNIESGVQSLRFGREDEVISSLSVSNDESSAFSPCANYFLSGHRDGTVYLWHLETGKITKSFSGHIENVIGVSFTPNGKYGLSVCFREYVCIWDLDTGKLIERFAGSNSGAGEVSFSGDGQFVAFSRTVCFDEMDKVEEASYVSDEFETPPEILDVLPENNTKTS